ncbi:MAG: DUF1800 domain-containing protein [Chitinophagaceae bacterium]
MNNLQTKNQHLLWRSGFGVSVKDMSIITDEQPQKIYEIIEKNSLRKPAAINVAENEIKKTLAGADGINMSQAFKNLSFQKRREIRRAQEEDLKNLNIAWMNEMVNSDAQLLEKMSFFWHGHFACRNLHSYYQQLLLDEVRNNALGNFGDLLKAVSKSASMLAFLNNQQNQKQHPNENFAREVMELFTMGRGNYTETDVKEAARAFTGWGFNLDGEFVFRKLLHDDGEKTFLGKSGNFDGDDVLNILLEQKATAKFITKKIYRYFVNENVDEEKVNWLADKFYKSNYDIKNLMQEIFISDWFYDEKNIATHIKSPVELLVGIRRALPMQLENADIQLLFEKALGQILFYPPNVAGWPGGKTWIDSSTLMLRLRLPQLIKNDEEFYLTTKPDDDVQMGMKGDNAFSFNQKNNNAISKGGFQVLANINWNVYLNQFTNAPKNQLYQALQSFILQTLTGSVKEDVAMEISSSKTREDYIKTITIALMSTPEYQLC